MRIDPANSTQLHLGQDRMASGGSLGEAIFGKRAQFVDITALLAAFGYRGSSSNCDRQPLGN